MDHLINGHLIIAIPCYTPFSHTHTIFLHIARSCGILWGSPSRHPSHWSKLWGSEEKWAKEWKHLHQIFPKYLLDNLLVLFPNIWIPWITCFLGLGLREKTTKRPKPQNASSTIVCRVYPHLHLSLKIAFVLDHVKQDVSRKPITFICVVPLP